MEQLTDGDNSNVIQFGLNDRSFSYEGEEEDLIESLLNEFSDFENQDVSNENEPDRLDEAQEYRMSFNDEPREMVSTLEGQIRSLKDQVSRLKFYLDEMYID